MKEYVTPQQAMLSELIELAKKFSVENIASVVISNPDFEYWTGSLNGKHHYGKHGLLTHTSEVIKISFAVADTLNIKDVSPQEIFLSALYHDIGKMYDYAPANSEKTEWVETEHKRKIHHISRSAIEWTRAIDRYPEHFNLFEPVLHNILSHHGLREWGSPVAPKSKGAYLLHLSDNMSARMNDCDKIDLIKIKK